MNNNHRYVTRTIAAEASAELNMDDAMLEGGMDLSRAASDALDLFYAGNLPDVDLLHWANGDLHLMA